MIRYHDQMELIKDNVMITWDNLGEGYHGDYNEDDPNDVNLLRFTVSVFDNGSWRPVDDGSYCTLVAANENDDRLWDLLNMLMDEFYKVLHHNIYASVKKLGEKLSWTE